MLTKMYKELREENTILLEENTRLTQENIKNQMWINKFKNECEKLIDENNELRNQLDAISHRNLELEKEISIYILDYQVLLDENRYLKQKVKEYRHKTWFPVYEENLKLQQELDQYKTVLTSVETFIGQYSKEKKGDKGCH